MKKYTILLLLVGCFITLHAQIKLPRLIADGLVLQRDTKLNIWGWASAGENISIMFRGNTYTTQASADGHWIATLPSQSAGGPYDMILRGKNEITLHNILVGDVWICSGQSNMEQVFSRLKDKYPDVIAKSENP